MYSKRVPSADGKLPDKKECIMHCRFEKEHFLPLAPFPYPKPSRAERAQGINPILVDLTEFNQTWPGSSVKYGDSRAE